MMIEPRDRNLRIRLTHSEEKIVLDLCEALHEKSRSRVVRRMIRESGGQGPDLLGEGVSTFREGLRQQAAMGRNLNQIAKALNAGHAPATPIDPQLLDVVLHHVIDLKGMCAEIISRSHNRWVRPPIGWMCPGCRQVIHGFAVA